MGAGELSSNADERIRVLVADDHPVVRTGLAAVIAQEPDLVLVARAENGEDGTERPFRTNTGTTKSQDSMSMWCRANRDAILIRGPCRAALGKRAIDTGSGRHWHWQSRGATDTVRLAQPFPPRRADSLLLCREAKALGIISEIVPRDVGTNIAPAK